uniref:Tubulin/FtsZ GTPase domain-containing protein n=1 Tax=Castor canadensis TaxID=51338 RepID=A0A8C0VUY9_CASCN
MTQSVVVQVGQCGNQIGCCFWDLVLREHAAVNQKGIYDEAISSFFRNVDTRNQSNIIVTFSQLHTVFHHLSVSAFL